MRLDVLIFGGGAAGLWLLDELHRAGHQVLLLEANALGAGQTAASQGIIHGGAKYTLLGKLTGSAKSIREMPRIWRQCLAGERSPNLTATRVRAECCHLWRTESLAGKVGLLGARGGLHVAPKRLPRERWPEPLTQCPGAVYLIGEEVIDPVSFVRCLADQHRVRTLKIDEESVEFVTPDSGRVAAVRLHGQSGRKLALEPTTLVFTAGAGNARLRERVGLTSNATQRRPLHMAMARGALPPLNGHCVDGAKTRVTITSDTDVAGRTVWLIGGQVAEDGVEMGEGALIEHTKRELAEVLPGFDLGEVEWAAYRVDRAEGATARGGRPDDVQIRREGNVITAWPTKLALAPNLAQRILEMVGAPGTEKPSEPVDWPRPEVAPPPWEEAKTWI